MMSVSPPGTVDDIIGGIQGYRKLGSILMILSMEKVITRKRKKIETRTFGRGFEGFDDE